MKIPRTPLCTLAAAVVLMSACSGQNGEVTPLELPGTSSVPASEPTNTTEPSMRPITILLDGWSEAGIAEGSLMWSQTVGGATEPVKLRAASGEDLRRVAERDPGMITQVAARMATAAPDLSCDVDGCRYDGTKISFEEIAAPQRGGMLAELYRGWGIETGVWIAEFPSLEAHLLYGGSRLSITQAPEGAPVEETLGVVDTGVHAVSIAFGTIFRTKAGWLGGKTGYSLRQYQTMTAEGGAGIEASAFLRGLSSEIKGVESMGESQLTWRSSPTTGCGVGVVCVPGTIDAEVTATAPQRYPVCNGTLRGRIELGAVDVRFTYPNPTHQYGIWGSEKPTGEIGGTPAVWTSTPPYVSGTVAQHHTYAHLYDNDGLYEKTGRVSTIGVDSEEETGFVPTKGDITKLFGGSWKSC